MSKSLTRVFKEPLFLLLLLGACIYGGYQWFQGRNKEVDEARIHVNTAQIDGMVTEWTKRWNRPPTKEEIDGLIQQYVRDEMLYRQAVAMELDKNDPITRRRTVQKLEFLTNELAAAQQPSDVELEQYFADNEADYRSSDTITMLHVFFNPDERGEATLDDAKAALAELKAGGEPDPETLEAGDKLMLQNSFNAVTAAEIGRQMGSGFAEAVMELEAGQWHGPVLSGFGVHLVYVFDLKKGEVPPFDSVKDKVLVEWHEEKREEFNAQFLEGLRERYEIVIDEIPSDRVLETPGDGEPEKEADGEEAGE